MFYIKSVNNTYCYIRKCDKLTPKMANEIIKTVEENPSIIDLGMMFDKTRVQMKAIMLYIMLVKLLQLKNASSPILVTVDGIVKSKINKYAHNNNVSVQTTWDILFFDEFLYRLSCSWHNYAIY